MLTKLNSIRLLPTLKENSKGGISCNLTLHTFRRNLDIHSIIGKISDLLRLEDVLGVIHIFEGLEGQILF